MQVRFLNNNEKLIASKLVNDIVNILKLDGVLALQTDTVPGLTCNIRSIVALKKIYAAKQRSIKKPCAIFVNSIDSISYFAKLNTIEHKLLTRFFPGALTLVLELKKPLVYDSLGLWGDYIGIRSPNDTFILDIIAKLGCPLFATSMNLSGCKPVNKWQDLSKNMCNNIDLYVDRAVYSDGDRNVASSVVQVVDDKIIVIREGVITKEAMCKAIDE
ncbi:L-threonylcarbamoyladenylate synthase [Candidatus Xenohaliotis californiensis]|uniref:L-threonylcarbamoyladenylate synthase n=1 Tax=Candidatus Xenohaliotis californiensis TaxID=84677 RepID=A0ABM9N7X8_9RICK|nr:L-threonylcarbamoyladenylate synthase [Candidatus Xenohaliotis californiensis]